MNSRVRAARMESLDDEVLLETGGVGIGVWMRLSAALGARWLRAVIPLFAASGRLLPKIARVRVGFRA